MKKEYANPMIKVTSFTTEHVETTASSGADPKLTNLEAARSSVSSADYKTEITWTF